MDNNRKPGRNSFSLRSAFEIAAIGIGATAAVATVATGAVLPAMVMGASLSAAYLLKKN